MNLNQIYAVFENQSLKIRECFEVRAFGKPMGMTEIEDSQPWEVLPSKGIVMVPISNNIIPWSK